jgi:hypothetical protein
MCNPIINQVDQITILTQVNQGKNILKEGRMPLSS